MQDLSPFYQRRNKLNISEIITVAIFVLGLFALSDVAKLSRYILSLLLQISLLIRNRRHKASVLTSYFLVLSLVGLCVVNFLINNIEIMRIINRALPLLAMFGVVLIGEATRQIDLKKVICAFTKIYVIIMLIVAVDYLIYVVTGTVFIWEPYIYLGARATGPLGDPNFLGLFSVAVLLIVWSMDFKRRYKIFASIVLIAMILLSLSLSTWLIFLVSIVANKILPNNNRKKAIIIFVADLMFLLVFAIFRENIFEIGSKILTIFYGGDTWAGELKFGSAMIRFDTQVKAIEVFMENWIGQGPHQMVPQLEHDTHNSYISFLFEGGLPELLIIFVTLRKKVSNPFNRILGTFLMLFALVLNVHDTAIWSLFILLQYYEDAQTDCLFERKLKPKQAQTRHKGRYDESVV